MNTRIYIVALTMLATLPMFGQKQSAKDRYIDQLMAKMTLEEKIAQLNLVTPTSHTGPFATKNAYQKLSDGTAGNIYSVMGTQAFIHSKVALVDSTRLKIPFLNGLDIIHGYATVFPIPLGLSCSWDMPLIERTARVAAIEGTAMGYNWTFSPMVDITRDPRWGRVMEGSGEDPYLGGEIARAMVRGYQGQDLTDPTSMMACVKHLGLYGAAEAGRDYNTTDMSRLQMYQFYLPPYKAAFEAGAGSAMTSFNEIDGIPATANRWLLTDLLRQQWGFDGFVVTDMNAMAELETHGIAEDYREAARLALAAGVDMDMASECMAASLKDLVQKGKVKEADINTACRRVLEAKYKLGLFSDPFRGYNPEREKRDVLSASNLQTAREAARKSIVMVKNEGSVLPLKKGSRIALIGPFADDQREMFSMWSFRGEESRVVTILEGIREQNPDVKHVKGTQLTDEENFLTRTRGLYEEEEQARLIDEARQLAEQSDIIVLTLGESMKMSGESKSKTDISLPDCQKQLLRAMKQTGKPVVLILLNGRPMTIGEEVELADGVLIAWRPGTEAGHAIADLLFGDYSPSGKLTMTFPRKVGQIPIYYNHKNTGRPYNPKKHRGIISFASYYLDSPNTPLYPFGYGLCYTTFQYGSPTLAKSVIKQNEAVTLTIDVTNTGQRAGDEIVQLYIRDRVASVTRPVKELKDFARITLAPGETQKVTFTITPNKLMFYNSDLKYVLEPGTFDIMVGPSSEDLQSVELKVDKQKG